MGGIKDRVQKDVGLSVDAAAAAKSKLQMRFSRRCKGARSGGPDAQTRQRIARRRSGWQVLGWDLASKWDLPSRAWMRGCVSARALLSDLGLPRCGLEGCVWGSGMREENARAGVGVCTVLWPYGHWGEETGDAATVPVCSIRSAARPRIDRAAC